MVGTQLALNVNFTNVPIAVVSAIYATHGTGTFVAGTPVTTGSTQYADDSLNAGTMNLTLQFAN